MIHWRTHAVVPDELINAVIAIHPASGEPDDVPFLLGEIYIWHPEFGCWMGERCGLKLRHDCFWWLPEVDLVGTLPK